MKNQLIGKAEHKNGAFRNTAHQPRTLDDALKGRVRVRVTEKLTVWALPGSEETVRMKYLKSVEPFSKKKTA